MVIHLRFTQNFLKSQALVEQIVRLATIKPGNTLLEIGPGKGIITAKLAQRVAADGKVIAVELDARLAAELSEKFRHIPQITILNENILDFPLETLGSGYAIFSNVPFNITSRLLEYLFNPFTGPERAHLILQKNAVMGSSRAGIDTETFKSLLIKPLYQVSLRHSFSKSDFHPKPGVETGLFFFEKRDVPLIDRTRYDLYKNFLAFISKDRVGEGAWLKIFTKRQISRMVKQTELRPNRGLKSQTLEAMVAAFNVFVALAGSRQRLVVGSMKNLRDEQDRTSRINQAGGHHRSNRKSGT